MASDLVECPKCGRLYAAVHRICPHCHGRGAARVTNRDAARTIAIVAGWLWLIVAVVFAAAIMGKQASPLPSLVFVLSGIAACPLTYKVIRRITSANIPGLFKVLVPPALFVLAIVVGAITETPQERAAEQQEEQARVTAAAQSAANERQNDIDALVEFHRNLVVLNHKAETADNEMRTSLQKAGSDFDMIALYQAASLYEDKVTRLSYAASDIHSPSLHSDVADRAASDALDDMKKAIRTRRAMAMQLEHMADSGQLKPSEIAAFQDYSTELANENLKQVSATAKAYKAFGIDISQIDEEHGGYRPKDKGLSNERQ